MVARTPQHILSLISKAYPGLITYIDTNLKYQFVNQNYRDWFDVNDTQILGTLVEELIGTPSFRERKPFMERALKGEKVKFITTLNHKILGKRELEQVYDPDIDEQGEVHGFITLAYDITDQRRAEKLALENEARFRSLTEVMPQLVWVADGDGKVIWFNDNWPRVTGTSLKENLGDGWLNVLHPEDKAMIKEIWQKNLTSPSYESEYRLRMKDESYRWHVSRAISMKDESGLIVRWVGTTTDIHEQKQIEINQTRLLQVLESSTDFIGTADAEGHVLFVNSAGREMVGLDQEMDLSKIKVMDFFFQEDKKFVDTVIIPTTLQKGSWVGDFRFKDFKTSEVRWVHYNLFTTHDEKTGEFTGLATVSRDISEMKRKERKLEEALFARDQFLSVASHELKTPLTSLKLQAQLTLRNLENSKELSIEKQIAIAHQTSDLVGRLTRLIDDMLDVSRIRTGKLKLDKGTHDMSEIIREVVFRMSIIFEAAGLSDPDMDLENDVLGKWDRFRIEQVIGNLLTNAIRYGRGKPINISLKKIDQVARLSVTDQGYGIAKDDLARIFDRYERAINSSEVSGLGLGLFITKEIVESHAGKIWVESELGKGATFIVELPL